MEILTCPICKSNSYKTIHEGIRSRIKIDEYTAGEMQNIDVLKCDNCGHVWLKSFIEDPNIFFEQSGMRDFAPPTVEQIRKDMADEHDRYYSDTQMYIKDKTICDFGCGSGGYLYRAKRTAQSVVGIEMEKTMRDAIVDESGKSSCYKELDEIGKVDIITMFHVLDHLQTPYAYIEKMKKHLNEEGKIYIETPNANDALLSIYNCKAFSDFTYYICHFMYYTSDSLRILAENAGLKIEFIKYKQRYPLANHLYWLRNGMPGGHEKWAFLVEEDLDKAYEQLLAKMGATDTITAMLSM